MLSVLHPIVTISKHFYNILTYINSFSTLNTTIWCWFRCLYTQLANLLNYYRLVLYLSPLTSMVSMLVMLWGSVVVFGKYISYKYRKAFSIILKFKYFALYWQHCKYLTFAICKPKGGYSSWSYEEGPDAELPKLHDEGMTLRRHLALYWCSS